MKTKLFLGTAAAAIALAGITISSEGLGDKTAATPFLHPLLMARSICGEQTDGLAQRRAFFVRAATAYARGHRRTLKRRSYTAPQSWCPSATKLNTAKPEAQAWFDQGPRFYL